MIGIHCLHYRDILDFKLQIDEKLKNRFAPWVDDIFSNKGWCTTSEISVTKILITELKSSILRIIPKHEVYKLVKINLQATRGLNNSNHKPIKKYHQLDPKTCLLSEENQSDMQFNNFSVMKLYNFKL